MVVFWTRPHASLQKTSELGNDATIQNQDSRHPNLLRGYFHFLRVIEGPGPSLRELVLFCLLLVLYQSVWMLEIHVMP